MTVYNKTLVLSFKQWMSVFDSIMNRYKNLCMKSWMFDLFNKSSYQFNAMKTNDHWHNLIKQWLTEIFHTISRYIYVLFNHHKQLEMHGCVLITVAHHNLMQFAHMLVCLASIRILYQAISYTNDGWSNGAPMNTFHIDMNILLSQNLFCKWKCYLPYVNCPGVYSS